MATATLPNHLKGKITNLGGLVFDSSGNATYTTLSTVQTALLALYSVTTGGAAIQNPPAAQGAIAPSHLQVVGVNTAVATTSSAIDSAVFPSSGNVAPTDGVVAQDPTNKLLLVRQAGKWYKTAALTQIA